MGKFDTVHVHCPNCAHHIKVQSKSGKCELKNYSSSSVPIDVAAALHLDIVLCGKCDTPLLLKAVPERIILIATTNTKEYD